MTDVLKFPDDFLWGTATSSHQVEGHNANNDWWAWEQTPGHIRNGDRSGLACDWWRRAEEDFDRARDLGQNTHRLSVEWSRVEPREGEWDEAALARYREMLAGLRQRGIEPMVTLHHFTNPLWLAARGGWENRQIVSLFARYAAKVVEALGDLCHLWCTINEPMVYVYNGFLTGEWPPGKRSFPAATRVARNMIRGHAAAYRTLHRLGDRIEVGIVRHLRVFDPANPDSALDRWAATRRDQIFNWHFLSALVDGRLRFPFGPGAIPEAIASTDFIGLNYYFRDAVAFDARQPGQLFGRTVPPEGAPEGSPDWVGDVYPHGLYRLLKRLAESGKPLYVTENGMPDDTDSLRPRYLLTHLAAVHRALGEGVPVKGYYHWTLVDNFEWAEGWQARFGLIALNPQTQERTTKRSGQIYAEVCRQGGLSVELLEQYAPEVLEEKQGVDNKVGL